MNVWHVIRRASDIRAAVIGYKVGSEPPWKRVMDRTLREVRAHATDEPALDAVKRAVQQDPKAAKQAQKRFEGSPPSYEADRAARLLHAALAGSHIQPPPPDYADLFEQENALARMPLREAFAQIVSREPMVKRIQEDVEHAVAEARRGEDGAGQDFAPTRIGAMRQVAQIIGPQSGHTDPLLRSYVSRNVVYRWFELIAGNPREIDPDAPYFGP